MCTNGTKAMWVNLLVPLHESRFWHQTIVVSIRGHLPSPCTSSLKMPIKNVLDETVRIIYFIKSWLWNTCLFLCDKMRSVPKVFLPPARVQWFLWRKSIGIRVSSWIICSFHWALFLLVLLLLISCGYWDLDVLADIFLKWTMNLLPQWAVFVALDKFWVFKQKLEF